MRQRSMVDDGPAGSNWPGTAMAIGIILWLIVFWFIGSRTLIGYGELFRWFALFAFAGNLVPYGRSGARLGMERLEWFLFNLLAIGPLLFALFLGLNYIGRSGERLYMVEDMPGLDVKRYWIENDGLPPLMVQDEGDNSFVFGRPPTPDDRVLGLANGLFGYEVITVWARIAPEEDQLP